jgi:hypothetical protein
MQHRLHAVLCVITDVTVTPDVTAAATPAAALLLYSTPYAMHREFS